MKRQYVDSVQEGDLFLHPTRYIPALFGSTQAIFKVIKVEKKRDRFGKPDRIVEGEVYKLEEGGCNQLRFIDKARLYAGTLEVKIPGSIDVEFVGRAKR